MVLTTVYLLLVTVQFVYGVQTVNKYPRTFEIDYDNDQFLKDGEPFRYISGSLHYFQVPRAYWRDLMKKYRAAGLNAISTYVEWKTHEPEQRLFDFAGERDLEYFIKLAEEERLLVVLRPGPYICSERDLGGYPTWILHEQPDVTLRTNDSRHTKYVLSWLKALLPKIQPFLYGNGGPIIMVQVENEYGSYFACDHNYTAWLRDVFRGYVKDKAVLFTTDGNDKGYFKCGPIPGVFTTVDFNCEGNVSQQFKDLREYQPRGPLVNSEFYDGWFTHWGDPKQVVDTDCVVNSTRQLLQLNASFNYYLFHGGTNFGLSSGANIEPFEPTTTSYDFNAPISENGNLTDKYFAIKALLSEFVPVENTTFNSSGTAEYGSVRLEPKVSLFDSSTGVEYGTFPYPRTFESLQLYSGLMLYETILPAGYSGKGYLVASHVHDRAIVYVNKDPAGVLSRSKISYSLLIGGQVGDTLSLLVENQGHVNYGDMHDFKGLIENVTLGGEILTSWKHTGFSLTNVSSIMSLPAKKDVKVPAYFSGTFQLPSNKSSYQGTFVVTTGWGKGVLYVNGFCLGRYWPGEGPQLTLYLPGTLLRSDNTVTLLELETVNPNSSISLVAQPQYSSTSIHHFDHMNKDDSNTLNDNNVSVRLL